MFDLTGQIAVLDTDDFQAYMKAKVLMQRYSHEGELNRRSIF